MKKWGKQVGDNGRREDLKGRDESGEDIRFTNQLTIHFNDNTPVSNFARTELIRLEMMVKANLG
jgi:hypothetical protein